MTILELIFRVQTFFPTTVQKMCSRGRKVEIKKNKTTKLLLPNNNEHNLEQKSQLIIYILHMKRISVCVNRV